MMKITLCFLFALFALSMANPIGNFGLDFGGLGNGLGFGLGNGGGNGLAGGFAFGRSISLGPKGVQTGGFGPIGGVIPFVGK